jgi:hypothetical protein
MGLLAQIRMLRAEVHAIERSVLRAKRLRADAEHAGDHSPLLERREAIALNVEAEKRAELDDVSRYANVLHCRVATCNEIAVRTPLENPAQFCAYHDFLAVGDLEGAATLPDPTIGALPLPAIGWPTNSSQL